MSDIGNKDVLAKNLALYVEKSGKTRGEICEDLGIAYSTFSEWINGRKYPRIDKIELLANYFGIMKSQLIESSNYPRNATSASPAEHSLGWTEKSEIELISSPQIKQVPVIGRVAAGLQCFADMQIDEYAPCDASLLHTGYDYVYLRVTGDSMEPELHEGDKVLVQVRDTVESGDYAVVIVDGDDGLVKKIEYTKTQLTLISENPYYPPRRFQRDEMNRVRIFGKVVGLSRSF